jgi:hypothetical protein
VRRYLCCDEKENRELVVVIAGKIHRKYEDGNPTLESVLECVEIPERNPIAERVEVAEIGPVADVVIMERNSQEM